MTQFTSSTSLIGSSLAIWKVKTYLRKVAQTDSHVVITGETGTGKELAAQYIHRHSTRHTKPLVTINCAALPDGLLESELFGYERGAFTGAVSSYAGKLKLADGGTVGVKGFYKPVFRPSRSLRRIDKGGLLRACSFGRYENPCDRQ